MGVSMEGLQENQGNNLPSWGMKPAKKASFGLETGTWLLAPSPAVCDTSAKSCPPSIPLRPPQENGNGKQLLLNLRMD